MTENATRATSSAIISFGLISIPIKTYISASEKKISFNMITPDGNRVKQQLVDAETGKPVDRASTKSGYQYTKEKYIVFSDDELKALEGDATKTIEIVEVVEGFKPAPNQIEKVYYLAPDKNADKAYRLLVSALEVSNKTAICKWFSRGRSHLVALRPMGNVLMMFQLYYDNECRKLDLNFANNSAPSDKEINLAMKLLDNLSSKSFDHAKYEDDYVARLNAAIEKKAAGGEIQIEEKKSESIFDLSALLEASLNKAS